MSSQGFNLAILARLHPGQGYGRVFPFDADGTITAAMDGGIVTNVGVSECIVLTIADAVQSIAVIQSDDFPIGIAPESGSTVDGYEDTYFVHSGEITLFTRTATGNFKVTTGKTSNNSEKVHNVREIGAMGDGSTVDTDAFLLMAGRCDNRGAIMSVPAATVGALPGYPVDDSIWGSLGTLTSSNMPGTIMDLAGRILTSVPQFLPGGARIIGRTSNLNTATPTGSMIRTTAAFPNDGTPILRIGRALDEDGWLSTGDNPHTTDEAADGSKLEWVAINGAGADNATNNLTVGVHSTSLQERSGLENCIIMNVDVGFHAEAGTGINPSNYVIRNTDVWAARRYGFKFDAGGKQIVEKCTTSMLGGWRTISNILDSPSTPGKIRVVTSGAHGFTTGNQVHCGGATADATLTTNLHAGTDGSGNAIWVCTVIDSTTLELDGSTWGGSYTSGGRVKWLGIGFVFTGSNWSSRNNHCEYMAYGATIGVRDDTQFWTYNGEIRNFGGHNIAGYPPVAALVRILADGPTTRHLFNIVLENLATNSLTNGVYLVQDDINTIYIPWSAKFLRRYEIAGDYSLDTRCDAKRPVFTSYYDWLCPQNRAVKGMVLDAATTQDVDRGYARGGNAGIIQFSGTAGGSAEEIRTLSDPKTGDQCYWHFRAATTIRHAAAGGTAAERFLCSGSADINAAADSYYRATYGDIRGAAIDAVNYASRWYVEQVA